MPDTDIVYRLFLSLAIGLVVGVERGWRLRDQPDGSRVAGIRTYGLSALLGGFTAALSSALSAPLLLGAGLLAYTGALLLFEMRKAAEQHTVSATSTIAGMAVFVLGELAVVGSPLDAAIGGVLVALTLSSRALLHNLLRRLSWVEVRSALLLLGMTVIILPLLPNRTVDPWGGVNPWEIWLFTVITATISYAGYIAIRLLGPQRGILVSAIFGAIASSTAVTMAFGRRARGGDPWLPLAGGACLAAMVSVLRVLAIVALVRFDVALLVLLPGGIAAATFGLIGAAILYRTRQTLTVAPELGNPFDLRALLLFAAGFAFIAAASAAASPLIGTSSVLITSGLTGIFNIDIAVLTAARQAGQTITAGMAAVAILVALLLNSLGRLSVGAAAGPPRYGLTLFAATAAAALTGGAAAVGLRL